MDPDLIDDTIQAWNQDATLTGADLLNGQNIYRYQRASPPVYPCVTLRNENESSPSSIGYLHTGKREEYPRITVDVWTRKTSRHGDLIEQRIDVLMRKRFPGTGKVSRSQAWDENASAWHTVARYETSRIVTDQL